MRAISLWQPWASAIALDAKRVETRGWATKYRGPLVIHAAARKVAAEMLACNCDWKWCAALDHGMSKETLGDILPFGALVAVVDLVDCRRTDDFTLGEVDEFRQRPGRYSGWTERQMGDFSLGRFGWVLENLRVIAEPIPFKGRQGFFQVPDELIEGAVIL